jgi:hypothetical protein
MLKLLREPPSVPQGTPLAVICTIHVPGIVFRTAELGGIHGLGAQRLPGRVTKAVPLLR